MTNQAEKITRYELLPGAVFIAPGDVPKDEAASDRYYVGTTVGGIEISLRENSHPIRDLRGETVCELRSGGRLEIKGKLAGISPAAIERLFAPALEGSPNAASVVVSVVCPIRGESEAFAIYMKASGASALKLSGVGQDAVEFSLVSERDFGKGRAKMSLAAAEGA